MPSPFALRRHQYPDPFLDIASTKLPKDRKKLLEMCYLFATTHPQIAPIVKKLAKYPITRIIINSDEAGHTDLESKWKDTLENKLEIYRLAEEMGLDYMGYGNAFITVHKPFIRSYQCKACSVDNPSGDVDYYLRGKKFYAKCPSCKKTAEMEGKDRPLKNPDEISIVRVPPQDMYIRTNELTGQSEYFRNVPRSLSKSLEKTPKPDRHMIDTTPWVYVMAALHKKKIKFGKGKILHLREPSLSGRSMEWGLPIIIAALKDAYLNQIYKKADETVANERTVPARFVYPQASSQDPLRTISLSKFSSFLSKSIKRFRYDKNAIMPVPFPVGVAEIGGDAQRLFTANIRELTIKEIIGSTGVPEGFLSDGMTWSGGSVQLRMLENILMSYLRSLNRMLWFVVKEVAKITEWPTVDVRFKPFRLQDDIQLLQIIMQLAQMKHVSFKEVLDRLDLSWDEQHDIVRRETGMVQEIQVQEALLEAKAALASVQYQVESQNRSQSAQQLLEDVANTSNATQMHLQRQGEFSQAKMEMENKEEGPDPEAEHRMAQAENLRANAEKEKVTADLMRQKKSVAPIVERLATGLLTMQPKQRDLKLKQLQENAPGIAEDVQARLEALQQEQPDGSAGEPADTGTLIEQLKAQSKKPEDLANAILMLPSQKKLQAFEGLQQSDPQLAMLVAKLINGMLKPKGGNQMGSSVDMRQLPEAKPPRR